MDWNVENNKLEKTFAFKSQTELANFLLKVAIFADDFKHHPDYNVFQASKVKFSLITHDKSKITDLDYKLSQKIDLLFNELN